ncbi:MAG: phosphoribosylaminoimidazolesuccinocarboxamide synthase [Vicinamibacterales bacterium]|jgi:phosphoribosylaminoimidazole-succinocarboxamide synthase|nr:phosphoribosylaminoimidazolesuccinocarboxamide synthase [Vicinamibacterales bacterium]
MKEAVVETRLEGLIPFRQGKVRDLYEVGDHLLIVATDRISAFDYILATGIPDKGAVLNQLSAFWFGLTADVVRNHVITTDTAEYPEPARRHAAILQGRSMLVQRTRPLAIECVVRGYLSGSGWKEYLKTGRVCGIELPAGLRESDRLPHPIFTPSTKAESGHDVNITEAEAAAIVGADVFRDVRDLSVEVYRRGAAHAEQLGIIVADTKFEFGLVDTPGKPPGLMLIDEVLTPDSSRFWPADQYAPGGAQPSYDKQYVRDYLEQIGWNKQPPAPGLPPDVVAKTREKYVEAYRRLTGRELA